METPRHFDFRKRIPSLDGLRGIAILAVFFRHYAGGLEKTATSGALHVLGMLFNFGWSGVDLFFVLSGFLITGVLYDTQDTPAYFKTFYGRRVLRIVPAYYLLAMIYLLLTPALSVHWRLADLSFLVYFGYPLALIWPAIAQVSPLVHVTHLWSICAEEQFYLIWPWAVSKFRYSSSILQVCFTVAVVALLLRIVICVTLWVSVNWTHDFLICRMDTIAVGAAIAIAVRGPLKEHLLNWAWWVFLAAGAFVLAIVFVRRTASDNDLVIASIGFTLIALANGALLLLALRQGSWLARLFSFQLFRTFGKYSYAMYLFDFPLTVFLSPKRDYFIAATHSFAIGSAAFLIFCLVVNLLVAAASFHLIEAPIMRLKSRLKYV